MVIRVALVVSLFSLNMVAGGESKVAKPQKMPARRSRKREDLKTSSSLVKAPTPELT